MRRTWTGETEKRKEEENKTCGGCDASRGSICGKSFGVVERRAYVGECWWEECVRHPLPGNWNRHREMAYVGEYVRSSLCKELHEHIDVKLREQFCEDWRYWTTGVWFVESVRMCELVVALLADCNVGEFEEYMLVWEEEASNNLRELVELLWCIIICGHHCTFIRALVEIFLLAVE